MRELRSSLLWGLLALLLVALVSSCGGVGGDSSDSADTGGSTGPYLTFSNAQEAASGTLDAARLFDAAGDITGVATSRIAAGSNNTGNGPVMAVINEVINVNSSAMARNSRSSDGAFSRQAATRGLCTNGGSMSTDTSGSDLTTDFHSCMTGSIFLDGSMTSHLVGDPETPSSMTITIPNLHVSDIHGGFDIVFSNFSMKVTVLSWLSQEITSMIVKLDGDVSGKIDSAAPGSVDISCDNYTATVRRVDGGETLSISGSFKTSECFSDWMTVMTTVPIFIPDGGYCPTAGEIISVYQSNSVKVDFKSDQQEYVYFDDSLTHTFSDCREAAAACF